MDSLPPAPGIPALLCQQTLPAGWEISPNIIFVRFQARFPLPSRLCRPGARSAPRSLACGNSVCSTGRCCPLHCEEMGVLSYDKDLMKA